MSIEEEDRKEERDILASKNRNPTGIENIIQFIVILCGLGVGVLMIGFFVYFFIWALIPIAVIGLILYLLNQKNGGTSKKG